MTFRPQISWFPWSLLCLLFSYSAANYIIYYPPFPGKNDQALLYVGIVFALLSERKAVSASLHGMDTGSAFFGSALVFSGCLVFIVGRLYQSMTMDIWSIFLVAAGLVAALAPREHLRSANFIAFAGTVVVMIGWGAPSIMSSELALTIASVCAKLLSATILPVIARGVVLYFGPYSAEVTEACSGMNSIFALTALFVIYLRVGRQRAPWHLALLVACVIPVAVLTNLGRVIMFVLATWYVGDDFAQGLFHEVAGVVAFVLALLLLAAIDRILFLTYSSIKAPKLITHADKQV
jgi:exosortase